jgi:hypothetical protein
MHEMKRCLCDDGGVWHDFEFGEKWGCVSIVSGIRDDPDNLFLGFKDLLNVGFICTASYDRTICEMGMK